MLWGRRRASVDLSGSQPISPFLCISLDRRAIENNGIQGAISKSENWQCWEEKEKGAVSAPCGSLYLMWAALVRQTFVLTGDYCCLILKEGSAATAKTEYCSNEQLSYFCPSPFLRCALNCTVKYVASPPSVIKAQVSVTEASLSR